MSRDANVKALEDLKGKGMTVTEYSPQAIAQTRERLKPVVEKHSKDFGETLVREMHAEIQKVRARN